MENSVNLSEQALFVLITERQGSKKGPPLLRTSGAVPQDAAMRLLLQYESEKQDKQVVRVGLYGWSIRHGVTPLFLRSADSAEYRLTPAALGYAEEAHVRNAAAEVVEYLKGKGAKKLLYGMAGPMDAALPDGEPADTDDGDE